MSFRKRSRRQQAARRVQLGVEQLESRLVPYSTSGNAWVHPELVTISFVPDGTVVGSNINGNIYSNLFASFNAKFGSAWAWQRQVLKAAQVWAQQTNLNFAVVGDDGTGIGGGANQQGDPGFGDIRIGGYGFGTTTLAQAYMPPPANNTSFAGDIQFNTSQNWNIGSKYDLFTVSMHEIGHALGLYHSGVVTAAMYANWTAVKAGLAQDDIDGIRSVYSGGAGRAPDAYDAAAPNGSFATATALDGLIDPTSLTALVTDLDLSSTADADYYTFAAPAGTGGDLTVNVQSSGLSLLSPQVTVYAADQVTVLGSASGAGQYGATLSVTVNGVWEGEPFFVKVSGAETGTGSWQALNTGRYALTLNFGTEPSPTVPLPNTTTANGSTPSGGGGQATKISDEFRANTATTGRQYLRYSAPRPLAMDANGNSVLAWTSDGQDGSGAGVYAQRFNTAGVPQGGEFRVNTYTTGDQYGPSVAMDPAGNFVIAWRSVGQDGSGEGVYAQRYNAAGTKQGSEFRVNTSTSGDQSRPVVAMDGAGNFVIVWDSYGQDGSGAGVYGQRYNAAGTKQGGEFRVNTYTSSDQSYASVAMDSVGNFVVVWSSYGQDGSSYGIYGQRYNAAGTKQGAEFRVNTTTAGSQDYVRLAMNAGGAFVVVWEGNGGGDDYGIYGQRYDAAGVKQGSEFLVNTTTADVQENSSVTLDNTGNFLVTWLSTVPGTTTKDVVGQQYNASGTPLGLEFRVTTTSASSTDSSAVVMDSQGHAVIAWSGSGAGDVDGVFAQLYAVGGGTGMNYMAADQLTPDGCSCGHGPSHQHNGCGCPLCSAVAGAAFGHLLGGDAFAVNGADLPAPAGPPGNPTPPAGARGHASGHAPRALEAWLSRHGTAGAAPAAPETASRPDSAPSSRPDVSDACFADQGWLEHLFADVVPS